MNLPKGIVVANESILDATLYLLTDEQGDTAHLDVDRSGVMISTTRDGWVFLTREQLLWLAEFAESEKQ